MPKSKKPKNKKVAPSVKITISLPSVPEIRELRETMRNLCALGALLTGKGELEKKPENNTDHYLYIQNLADAFCKQRDIIFKEPKPWRYGEEKPVSLARLAQEQSDLIRACYALSLLVVGKRIETGERSFFTIEAAKVFRKRTRQRTRH